MSPCSLQWQCWWTERGFSDEGAGIFVVYLFDYTSVDFFQQKKELLVLLCLETRILPLPQNSHRCCFLQAHDFGGAGGGIDLYPDHRWRWNLVQLGTARHRRNSAIQKSLRHGLETPNNNWKNSTPQYQVGQKWQYAMIQGRHPHRWLCYSRSFCRCRRLAKHLID